MNKKDSTLNLFGEFSCRKLENEFLSADTKRFSRFTGWECLIFGVLFFTFAIPDAFSFPHSHQFWALFFLRSLFLLASVFINIAIRKAESFRRLTVLITLYECLSFAVFFPVLLIYGPTLGEISFFSAMAITLAIYITPNRLFLSQTLSLIFNVCFFLLYQSFAGFTPGAMCKYAGYCFVFLVIGNMQAYQVGYYRRQQFLYSRRLQLLSSTDALTGAANRAKFDEELEKWIRYCTRYGNSLTLVIFDIDRFKLVNDDCGHLVGDEVLRGVSAAVAGSVRATDVFARWGGDEFAILFPNTGIREAQTTVERIRAAIGKYTFAGERAVSCSFGLAALHREENAESLLRRADKLLYRSKKLGGDAVSSEND